MAGGQHYSAHQRKIINRYYEHRDTIALNKLGELVSELYLCEDKKKADRLWKQVQTHLEKTDAAPATRRQIIDNRDLTELGRILGQLGGK
jgi:hypothetical protein